jgi:endonuclease/exonuclease/phosphatase family metal-dependent hydrolase
VTDYTRTRRCFFLLFAAALALAPGVACSELNVPAEDMEDWLLLADSGDPITPQIPPGSPRVVIDGILCEWSYFGTKYEDPAGDGAAVDFGELKARSNDQWLYLYFEVGAEMNLQGDNRIVLYLDSDNSASTGFQVGGIGADWKWIFGAREGEATGFAGTGTFRHSAIGLRQAPTVSSTAFEVAIARDAVLAGVPHRSPQEIAILLRDEDGGVHDRLPDEGEKLVITLYAGGSPERTPLNLARRSPHDLRVLTYNVLRDRLFSRREEFGRIIKAVRPDVICFQEMYRHSAPDVENLLQSFFPGSSWNAVGTDDCVIASHYRISSSSTIPPNYQNIWAFIDLPDSYPRDLSIISAHPACCGKNEERQEELDAIVALMRELVSPGGRQIPEDSGIIIAGDMNLVTYASQVATLTDGAIADMVDYGPSHACDWDGTPLRDVHPYHTTDLEAYTWRDDADTFAPGKLDYIVYSDSVLSLKHRFILWTPDLTGAELAAAGLEATDTEVASDHLPIVADFQFREAPVIPEDVEWGVQESGGTQAP